MLFYVYYANVAIISDILRNPAASRAAVAPVRIYFPSGNIYPSRGK
jgi:hypothetical protein